MESIGKGVLHMTIRNFQYDSINYEEPPYGEIEYIKANKKRKYRLKK
jgi:hypothetical protein